LKGPEQQHLEDLSRTRRKETEKSGEPAKFEERKDANPLHGLIHKRGRDSNPSHKERRAMIKTKKKNSPGKGGKSKKGRTTRTKGRARRGQLKRSLAIESTRKRKKENAGGRRARRDARAKAPGKKERFTRLGAWLGEGKRGSVAFVTAALDKGCRKKKRMQAP